MIEKGALQAFVEKELDGTSYFLVGIEMNPGNVVDVEIDADGDVDISECERISRAIEAEFAPDSDDYEITVGSAGLTSPLKMLRQYKKYMGREVEVLPREGKKVIGVLTEAGPESFTVVSKEKVKKPDQKRPVEEEVAHTYKYDEIKYTKYHLKF